tara:strand:+ start:1029 stop:1451 length:423 start_codon:yes stop_codon:yes gene_type:complete
MAMFVGGVQVTGTQTLDATKLTGNLPAISGASLTALTSANITANGTLPALNGSNLTSLPASIPSLGATGSYAMLQRSNYSGGMNQGSTWVPGISGNNNDIFNGHWSDSNGNVVSGQYPSGTWRLNGRMLAGRASVFIRLS